MDPPQRIERSRIIAILGPTATGKTAAAVYIARRLNGEIISADSVAVYRGLDVGTAKPTREERRAAAFHLIDVADPDEPFTAARFRVLAEAALDDICARGKQPLLVGGTGLYVRVLLEGYGLTATPADPALRAQLEGVAVDRGGQALHEMLRETDPVAAGRIHPNDRVRVIRALEVTSRTGRPMSEQQAEDSRRRAPLVADKFVFTLPREELDCRIDTRVDAMIAAGLEEEVRGLLASGCSRQLNALRSLGYKEMIDYLSGECSREDAILAIKRNTRRFARRQLTWFRSERDAIWLDVGGISPRMAAEAVLARLEA